MNEPFATPSESTGAVAIATALRLIRHGAAPAEVAGQFGVPVSTLWAWESEYGQTRLEAVLARRLSGDCELRGDAVERILAWRKRAWDVLLLHPPCVIDSGEAQLLPLPWTHEHIGSAVLTKTRTLVGPHWPVPAMGLGVLAYHLARRGVRVGILNLAGLATWPCRIFPERQPPPFLHIESGNEALVGFAVQQMRARVFAVSLQWIVHTAGAIALLRLIKQVHPTSYTVIGGLTASFFARQVMSFYPFIDSVIIGDGCVPLEALVQQITHDRHDLSAVPNLLYRDRGQIRAGPSVALSDQERVAVTPSASPIVQLGRGCPMNCATCGGSCQAGRRIWRQPSNRPYDLDTLMERLCTIARSSPRPQEIFLVHDPIVMLGRTRWHELLTEIARQQLNARFIIEAYQPLTRADIRKMADAIPGSSIHFSPESIDESIRYRQRGVRFSNRKLMENIEALNDTDALSFSVWFMAGVAGDDASHVGATVDFIAEQYPRLRHRESCYRYNTLTFLDPGSNAWMNPGRYDYRLLNGSLPWYVESTSMPHFKHHINYTIRDGSRSAVFRMFLRMHDRMNRIYRDNGVLSDWGCDLLLRYHGLLRKYEEEYDRVAAMSSGAAREGLFGRLGAQVRQELLEVRGEPLGPASAGATAAAGGRLRGPAEGSLDPG